MAISGIGATGYPTAGYEIRRTERNIAGKNFSGQMDNVKSTQGTGITLYISNPEDGEAIGSMGDHDSYVTVRRHIAGGANRTLISVITPFRLCRIGTCRRLSSG